MICFLSWKLRKLRKQGRNQINIYSVTTETSYGSKSVIGMRIGYSDDDYANVFSYGDTKEDVYKKAERIYIKKNLDRLRKKYRKKILSN